MLLCEAKIIIGIVLLPVSENTSKAPIFFIFSNCKRTRKGAHHDRDRAREGPLE